MRNVILAWVVVAVAFAAYVRAADTETLPVLPKAVEGRDIIVVRYPGCGDFLPCASALHFNGNWSGVKLCRAETCVRYEEVFSAKDIH